MHTMYKQPRNKRKKKGERRNWIQDLGLVLTAYGKHASFPDSSLLGTFAYAYHHHPTKKKKIKKKRKGEKREIRPFLR
jgi:hypothetical protein